MFKRTCTSAVLLLTVLWIPACLANKSTTVGRKQTESDVVQIKIMGFTPPSEVVAQSLSKAVKSDPKSNKFRVSGTYAMGGGSGSVTVLYNRIDSTIKFFAVEFNASGGRVIQNYHYIPVSDELIYKLDAALAAKDGKEDMNGRKVGAYYFDELVAYGCEKTGGSRYTPAK